MRWAKLNSAIVVAILFVNLPLRAADPPPPALAPELSAMLAWLPQDTESIMVARGPYPKSVEKLEQERADPNTIYETDLTADGKLVTYRIRKGVRELVPPPTPAELLDQLQAHAITFGPEFIPIEFLGKQNSTAIKAVPLRWAMSASRKFGPVKGIGDAASYEGCRILFFEQPLPEIDVKSLPAGDQGTQERIEGKLVLKIMNPRDRKNANPLAFYIARPAANVLILSDHREFLATLLGRITRPGAARVLPADRPEWKLVRTETPLWGLRVFRDVVSSEKPPVDAAVRWNGFTYHLDTAAEPQFVIRFRTEGARPPDKLLHEALVALVDEDPNGKSYQLRLLDAGSAAEARVPARADMYSLCSFLMGYAALP